jgi:hypothetical protein
LLILESDRRGLINSHLSVGYTRVLVEVLPRPSGKGAKRADWNQLLCCLKIYLYLAAFLLQQLEATDFALVQSYEGSSL